MEQMKIRQGQLKAQILGALQAAEDLGMIGLLERELRTIFSDNPDTELLLQVQEKVKKSPFFDERVVKHLKDSRNVDNILCNHLKELRRKNLVKLLEPVEGEKYRRYAIVKTHKSAESDESLAMFELAMLRQRFKRTSAFELIGHPEVGIWMDGSSLPTPDGVPDEDESKNRKFIFRTWLIGWRSFLEEQSEQWDWQCLRAYWERLLALDESVNKQLREYGVKPTLYMTSAMDDPSIVVDGLSCFGWIFSLEDERLRSGRYTKETAKKLKRLPKDDKRRGMMLAFYSYVRLKAEALPQRTKRDRGLNAKVAGFIPSPLIVVDFEQYKTSMPERLKYTAPMQMYTLEKKPDFRVPLLPEGTAGLPSSVRIVGVEALSEKELEALYELLDSDARELLSSAKGFARDLRNGWLLVCSSNLSPRPESVLPAGNLTTES